MHTTCYSRSGRRMKVPVIVAAVLAALLIARALDSAATAQAAGTVMNCSSNADFYSKLGSGGLVTFNCPFPSPTVITVSNIIPAANTTVDGTNNGRRITLSGGHSARVFDQWATGGILTLTHLIVRDGFSGGSGGCILNEGSEVALVDVLLTHCVVTGYGGGYYALTGTLRVDNAQVISNSATIGGGIFSGGAVTVTNSLLSDNYANSGGAIGMADGSLLLNNSTVSGNMAEATGGGIKNAGTARLNDSTVSDNQAFVCGGIINDGALVATRVQMSGNQANSGGAMCNSNIANLLAVTLSGNTAVNGGGIFVLYNVLGSNLTIRGSTLSGNSATGQAGAVYLATQSALNIYTSTVSGNTALNGGGIYDQSTGGSSINLYSVTFSGNQATNSGGGYYELTGNVHLYNTTFSGNSASGDGGGFRNSSSLYMENTTFSGNSAGNGGGLDNLGLATLRNVTLSNNTATLGGALRTWNGGSTTLVNTLLAYSQAGGNCSGSVSSAAFSISSDNSCALTTSMTIQNFNNLDPLLTGLGNYGGPTTGVGHDPLLVNMLKAGSPAIGGVVGNNAPVSDERGKPRPGPDGSYDSGAVERQADDSNLAPHLFLPLLRR